MKKLLSILTISTLTASIPAPLLANTPATRTLTSNSNNDYLPIKEFKNINVSSLKMTIDSKDNIYIGTSNDVFVLKHGETTATKLDGIITNAIKYSVNSLGVDSKDNIYFLNLMVRISCLLVQQPQLKLMVSAMAYVVQQ
ncbi:hypothetical protein [Spiroplasma citri]|uniref:hypothetical protein n=1 Tax=Spiroplasma citri TaxID=2133 RepID=UPI00148B277C|nr:hypothetical protein [Spiroplasma citri]QJU62659.1 hypothetical protein HHA36_10280 [Spiroplasma citri]